MNNKWFLWGVLLVCGGVAQAQNRPFLVCIDPGHPSETARGASANGLKENTLNWQVALRLQKRLNALGIASVLTKSSLNQTVTNRRRAEIANGDNVYRIPSSMFIRLHCDAGGGSGFAWYYPDRAARKQGVTGPPRAVQIESRALAQTMNEAMKPVLRGSLAANPIKNRRADGRWRQTGRRADGFDFRESSLPRSSKCVSSTIAATPVSSRAHKVRKR
jgi:N-acetylmuramoyl-L-alanine amidase